MPSTAIIFEDSFARSAYALLLEHLAFGRASEVSVCSGEYLGLSSTPGHGGENGGLAKGVPLCLKARSGRGEKGRSAKAAPVPLQTWRKHPESGERFV